MEAPSALNETVDELLRSLLPSYYGNSQRWLWDRRWVTSSTSRDPHKALSGRGSTASEELTLTAVTPSPTPLMPVPPPVSTRALRVQQHQLEEELTVRAYPHQRVRRLRQRYRPLRPDHQRVAPAASAALVGHRLCEYELVRSRQ
eukprot:gene6234-4477_t